MSKVRLGVGLSYSPSSKPRQAKASEELSALPPCLQALLGGRAGETLWDFAWGRDARRVEPPKARKSIGAEVNWGVRFESGE